MPSLPATCHFFVVTTDADVHELKCALSYLSATGYPISMIQADTDGHCPNEPRLNKLVSLLLPSRHRFSHLKAVLHQFVSMTAKPEQVELILGVDLDDIDTLSQLTALPVAIDTCIVVRSHGQGYTELYHLANQMAQVAHGEFLLFYTDDAVMQTFHWDLYLEPYHNKLCAFKADTQDNCNLFPIVSKQMVEMMGHLSLHTCADTWIDDVAKMLDIQSILPIQMLHDQSRSQPHSRPVAYIDSYFETKHRAQRRQDAGQIMSCIHADLALLNQGLAAKYLQNITDLWQIYSHFYGFKTDPIKRQWFYARDTAVKIMNLLEASDIQALDMPVTIASEVMYLLSHINNMGYLIYTYPWNEQTSYAYNADEKIQSTLSRIESGLQHLLHHVQNNLMAWYYLACLSMLQHKDEQAVYSWQRFIAGCHTEHNLSHTQWWQLVSPFGPLFLIHQWEELLYVSQSNTEAPYKTLLLWQAWHMLGELRQKKNQLPQALGAYQMAHQVLPGQLLTHFRWIQILWMQGQQAQFQVQWQIFMAETPCAKQFANLLYETTTFVFWQTIIPEIVPPLGDSLGISLVQQGQNAPDCTTSIYFQRVYDRYTDFYQGLIGPDTVPFFFPPLSEQAEITGLTDFNLLIVVDDFLSDETQTLIRQCEQMAQDYPAMTCILWHPLQVPTAAELEGLATIIEPLKANFMVLPDPFLLTVQASLLTQCQVIGGYPKHWLCYYLWWGVYLGIPLLLPNPLPLYHGGITEIVSVKPDVYPAYVDYKQQALKHQQRLKGFYDTQAVSQLNGTLIALKKHLFAAYLM